MKIILNRPQILVVGLIILGFFIGLNRLLFLIDTAQTDGVATYRFVYGEVEQVVEFEVKGEFYYIPWSSDRGVEEGEVLPIRFKCSDPTNAHIFTFWGFWMLPVFNSIGLLIVWVSYVYSYFSSTERLGFIIPFPNRFNPLIQLRKLSGEGSFSQVQTKNKDEPIDSVQKE